MSKAKENTDLKEQIDAICAEYAAWAGNDLTTSNFKRLEDAIEKLVHQARADELKSFLDVDRNQMAWLMENRIKELESKEESI